MLKDISRDYNSFNLRFSAAQRILGENVYMSTDSSVTQCNGNILLIGASGTGKELRFFTSNILMEQASMVIHDPSGAYWDNCEKKLKEKGYVTEQVIVVESEATTDFDWNRLETEKLALFVKSERSECGAEQVSAWYQHMLENFDGSRIYPKNSITLFMDEFASIKEIADFRRYISCSGRMNIKYILGIQAIEQLRQQYGKDKSEIIIGMCGTFLYYGGCDPDTWQFVSMKIGYIFTKSFASKLAGGIWERVSPAILSIDGIEKKYGKGLQKAASLARPDYHALIEPEEAAKVKNDECLIFVCGYPPLLAKKYHYGIC